MKCKEIIINGETRYQCPACSRDFKSIRSCSAHMSSCRDNVGEDEYQARLIRRSEGMKGYVPTEETRRKLAEAMVGKKHSEETKAKISESHKGKTLSEETKSKISESLIGNDHGKSLKGYKHSEEFRERISKARIGMKFSPEHCKHIRESKLGVTPSKEALEKRRESMLKRYQEGMPSHGVGNAKRSRSNGYTFRSRYESVVACFLQYLNIDYGYEDIRVVYSGRTFIMDFRVGATLIEVKGFKSKKDDLIKKAFESNGYEVEIIYGDLIDILYKYLKSEGLNVEEFWDKMQYYQEKGEILEWKVQNNQIVFLN